VSHDATTEALLSALAAQRVLPVLRTASADEAVDAALTCVDAGLAVVELTATTPGWPDALSQVRDRRPGCTVGLGTVSDAATARTAVQVGTAFLVSPWPAPDVRGVAEAAGVPFVEGTFSPGEVAASAARGAVKIFPAHAVGPDYLRSLRQVLPEAVLVPTGGITLDEVPDWLAAGALAAGVGSDLLRGDLAERLAHVLATT
jgi:2-dehydro-3-deoxyphosphogluconate aldolase / (4S)-4-hydroxy-2-oxoglutarate aldolase